MKQERSYPKVIVSPKGERSVLYGHPWIYDQEVSLPEDNKDPENGFLVDAFSTKGAYLGTGSAEEVTRLERRLGPYAAVKIPNMMHGEFVLMHPEAFAERALAFLG